jgi:hypothetical protein
MCFLGRVVLCLIGFFFIVCSTMLVAIVVWFGWLVGRIPVTDGTGVLLQVSFLFTISSTPSFFIFTGNFVGVHCLGNWFSFSPSFLLPLHFYRCATHLLPVKYIREWAFSENSARLRVNGIPIEMINRSDSFES